MKAARIYTVQLFLLRTVVLEIIVIDIYRSLFNVRELLNLFGESYDFA